MSTEEKLKKIKARCEWLLTLAEFASAEAGWRSTIAAVDEMLNFGSTSKLESQIISALEGILADLWRWNPPTKARAL
mgnify:CR=1 FL=1